MWGTKSRFVVVIISKIGWNPGNEFGKNSENLNASKNDSIAIEYFKTDAFQYC